MKITHRGKPPAERVWKGECRNCGTRGEAVERELRITHDQRDGSFGTIACPVCSGEMFFYPLPRPSI